MESKVEKPKVGVDVIIRKDDMVLLHERKDNNGNVVWHVPGGHLEFLEEVGDCAKREVKEEMGIDIKDIKIAKVMNNIYDNPPIHYVVFYVESFLDYGEPKIMEPNKCTDVRWFKPTEFPTNLFPSLQRLVDTGYFK